MNGSGGSTLRGGSAALAVLGALVLPAGASAATVSESFPAGEESTFTVPDGIELIDVEATGAKGGDSLSATGGLGALVTGSLTVESNTDLFVVVGTNGTGGGTSGVGGFNGGGSGSSSFNTTTAGAGGGGATDIRTISRFQPGTLESRLLVAGGGGGAGGRGGSTQIGGQTYQGGVGGGGGASLATAAGADGSDGAGSGTNGGSVDANTRGRGGKGASTAAGGAAGAAGTNPNGNGTPGVAGSLGTGGNGGTGMPNSPQGRGGGGGGGLYGGGGGGSSTINSTAGSPNFGGAGGGGAGSSLVPAGGSVATAAAGSTGSATISYTFAETAISGPDGDITTPSPTYTLSSPDTTGATFECSVDGADFAACDAAGFSPGPLAVGDHEIRARAIDPVTGNADPAPAVVDVTVLATELALGKPKVDRKQGTATLPATVDRAGRIVATGKGLKRASVRRDGPGTSRLAIKATADAAKRLRRTGKLTLHVAVDFTPDEGEPVSRSKTVKLVRERR